VALTQFCRERSINPKYFSTRKKQLACSTNSFVQVAPLPIPSSAGASVKLRVIEAEVPNEALLDTLSRLLDQRER